MRTYKNYVDGKWVSSSSKKTFFSENPATLQKLGKFQLSNKKDVDKAVESARKAFKKWREVPAPKRGDILFKVAGLLKRDKERLAKLLTIEMCK